MRQSADRNAQTESDGILALPPGCIPRA